MLVLKNRVALQPGPKFGSSEMVHVRLLAPSVCTPRLEQSGTTFENLVAFEKP